MNPDPLYLSQNEIRLDRKHNQSDPAFEARKLAAQAEESEDAAEWLELGATQIIDAHELTRGTNGKD